jgi:tRNA 2-thiouridine synthesizing protein A
MDCSARAGVALLRRHHLFPEKYYHGLQRAKAGRASIVSGRRAAGETRGHRSPCRMSRAWLQWKVPLRQNQPFGGATMNFDKELDARGLNCPLPILRAKKALTEMQSGQVLRIVSTDVGSVKDFQAFCKQTGNELLSQQEGSNEYTFFLKRK